MGKYHKTIPKLFILMFHIENLKGTLFPGDTVKTMRKDTNSGNQGRMTVEQDGFAGRPLLVPE